MVVTNFTTGLVHPGSSRLQKRLSLEIEKCFKDFVANEHPEGVKALNISERLESAFD